VNNIIKSIKSYRALRTWRKRGCLDNAPQFVKENVFLRYGIPNANWVETGTFQGKTTDFLERNFGKVYSIEPAKALYDNAVKKFSGRDVALFNDVSEAVFPSLLPTLGGDCNFWLDGHYSAGATFQGMQDCPINDELASIAANLDKFTKVAILIDDIRCFHTFNTDYPDYPSLDSVVDWARAHGFNWCIEQDILIMRNFTS